MKRFISLLSFFLIIPEGLAHNFSFKHFQTKQGTNVVFYQTMTVPMLNINLAFKAGSAYDGEHYGLSALTTKLINQGTTELDANTIAERLANTGAQLQTNNTQDMIVLNLVTLSEEKTRQEAINLFAQIITKANFPMDAFKREQNQLLITIKKSKESPNELANQSFFKALYQQHPYAHPITGYKKTVEAITDQQVQDFYKHYFVARNATLVMVGAISLEEAKNIAETLTQQLPVGQAAPDIPKAQAVKVEDKLEMNFPSSQTMIRLGQLGIDHHHPDYLPLIVGNYILGGGVLVSRLSSEVREKRGLSYGVTSQLTPMPGNGPFIIGLSTQNAQAALALDVVQKTLKEFVEKGPNQDELIAAQKYLTGSFALSLASNSDIAATLLRVTFYKLPNNYLDTYIDHIQKVGVEDIKRAFASLIHPNKQIIVEVGAM